MNWISLPLVLPLCFFLPGYFLVRLFFSSRQSFSGGERVFTAVAFSIGLTLWVGLTLAEFGAFSIWAVSACMALICAGLWLFGRKRFTSWDWRELKPDWIFVALLMFAIFLFARPAEYLLGNSDAGTYINTGANIARTGAIAIYDEQVAQLPFDSAKAFYWQLINPFMLYKAVRLPGFFVADAAQGLVLPQFLHLYPVWLAWWDSLVGVEWGLYATPLIALLASIAFYFLAREIFCAARNNMARAEQTGLLLPNARARKFARLAFFLLIVCVPQFWFARYPVAEALTQFLMLTGIWALLKFETTRDGLFGLPLLAGIAFGEIFMTRADAILLLVPLALYFLIRWFTRTWRRETWIFFGAFTTVFMQAVIHMLAFAPNYLYFQYSHALRMKNIDKLLPGGLPKAEELFSRGEYILFLPGMLVAGAVGLFLLDRVIQLLRARVGGRAGAWWTRSEKWVRVAGAVSIVLVLLGAYFVWARPESWYAYVGGVTPLDRSANLIKLGWYLAPIGIALATLGAVIVVLRDLNTRNIFFFGTAALFTIFYLEELYSNPHYIYTTRHYIPLVIPLFILLTTRALDWLWHDAFAHDAMRHKIARWGAGGAFALWMLYTLYAMGVVDASRAQGVALRVPFVSQTTALGALKIESFGNSIVGVQELGGAYRQIEALSDALPPNAVIIFSAGRDEPAALATPLKYIFGHDAFVSVFNNPPGDKIAAMADTWRAQGREVILAYGTNGGRLQIPGYALERIGDAVLDVPQWAFAYEFMPRGAWRVNLNYTLYRAVPRAAPADASLVMDFGGDDFPYLLNGFLERAPEANTRWIGALVADAQKASELKFVSGLVRVPLTDKTGKWLLRLRARAPREGARLILKSGDEKLATFDLTTEFAEFGVVLAASELKWRDDSALVELAVEATPDGQGRVLGAELQELRVEKSAQ